MSKHLDLPEDYEPIIYIVDDDESVCESISGLIDDMGFLSKPFFSAEDFIAQTENSICGCVLADLRMVGCNGIEMLKKMKTSGYEIPLIMVSAYADVTNTVSAMSAGALTVLEKPFSDQQLWDTTITGIILDSERRIALRWLLDFQSKLNKLTNGEIEVMQLLLKGKSNKSINHLLDVSARTVVMRRKAILEKFEVDNVIDLVKMITKAQTVEQYLSTISQSTFAERLQSNILPSE
tara:strand:- start:2502 stop:3209 length:708 start_codon:yes stop_codon:yes gene_type:complete